MTAMIQAMKTLLLRIAPMALLTCAALTGPAVIAQEAPAASGEDVSTTESVETARSTEAARPNETAGNRRGDLAAKIWWNQSAKIAEIGLSDAQRARMDEILSAYLETRGADLRAQRQTMEDFGAALATGDEAAVRQRADAAVEAAARPVRQQLDLMFEVVVVLSAEQRQKLVERYPRMFSRPWILNANPRRLRGGGGG